MNELKNTFGARARYFIESPHFDTRLLIDDPEGSGNDDVVMSRDKSGCGIVRKASVNLKFYQGRNGQGGADTLIELDETYGVKAEAYLVKEIANNKTNVFEFYYRMKFDFTKFSKEVDSQGNYFISIPANEGGIYDILNSRKDEDVEIERKFAIDDALEENELTPINKTRVGISDRAIELKSKQESNLEDDEIRLGNEYPSSYAVTSDLVFSSIEYFQAVTSVTGGYPSTCWWADSDDNEDSKFDSKDFKTILKYDIKVKDIEHGGGSTYLETLGFRIIYYDRSGVDTYLNVVLGTDLYEGDSVSGEHTLSISTDDISGIAYRLYIIGESGTGFGHSATLTLNEWIISNEAISRYPTTATDSYSYLNAANRLMEIYSGKPNLVESNFLGTGGIGEGFMFTDGGKLRNIPEPTDETDSSEEKTWTLTTNLKELLGSLEATWNLGMGIIRKGLKETLIIEERDFFFQPYVVLELGKLNKIKRKKASELIYSGFNIGFDGNSEIEGVQGLDKLNGKANRISTITEQKNVYEKISKYQIDDYLIKLQRVEQFVLDPTTDGKYDDTKFVLDTKVNTNKSSFSIKFNDNDLIGDEFSISTQYTLELPLFCTFTNTASNINDCLVGASILETKNNFVSKVNTYHSLYTAVSVSDDTVFVECNTLGRTLSSYTSTEIFESKLDIEINNEYEITQRGIEDDFDTVAFTPTGVFDVTALKGGRWSPLACYLRHGSHIKNGLSLYPETYLSYGANNSNSEFEAILKEGVEYPYLKGIKYKERDNIKVDDLQRELYKPEWIEGEYLVDLEIMNTLNGFTEIDGQEVPNFYCLVEFENEYGERESAFVQEVRPNGKGKWKFLAFRKIKG